MQIISLIGSFVIAGYLVLMIHQSQSIIIETNYQVSLDRIAQSRLAFIYNTMHVDMRRLGHLSDPPRNAIRIASPSELEFTGDIDLDGIVETTHYWISDTSACPDTTNPNDRILYREIDGVIQLDSSFGVTDLEFLYYDETGQQTAVTTDIISIGVRIEVQSLLPYPDGGQYGVGLIETRLTPRAVARINW